MGGVQVRRLRRQELDAFQVGMPSWNAAEYAHRLAAQERGSLVQVVAWDGAPVGRGMVLFDGHPEWSVSARREGCAEVRDVAVSSPHRRRGVATAMMAELERAAIERGWARIGLSVALDGEAAPARALYAGLGYRHAHGPYVSTTALVAEDGDTIPVGAVLVYLLKDMS